LRIKSIITSNYDELTFEKINLFEGPNSVGKSRILRVICEKMLVKNKLAIF